MNSNRKVIIASLAVCLAASLTAFGASDDKAEVKGMIITRTGETLIVNGPGGKTTVVLTDTTRTKDNVGLFGMDRLQLADTVLIPGTKVKVEGMHDEHGRVVAKTITVDGDDLETAEMIQAGLHPTAQQVAANVKLLEEHNQKLGGHDSTIAANQAGVAGNKYDIAAHSKQINDNMNDIKANSDRFAMLADFDVKGEATIKFKTGSSKLTPEDVEQIKQLAGTATALTGYIVEVMGYADATGGAEMNTKLSEDRAKAVITTLIQQGNVPVRHIVAPGAMGEYGSVAPNETKEGRAENRRVVVKVLLNKGIAGS